VPLVRLIGAAVAADAKPWVHHGATSQDIVDTALMLMSQRAGAIIIDHLDAAADACATLADGHRGTVMVARTVGQQAAPTTFGRKAAGWLVALCDTRDRLVSVCSESLAVQLGGPVGTLAAFGSHGDAVVAAYADRLGLRTPTLPWHTDRRRVAELAGALAGVAAAAGKIATDVILLAQTEVGEISLAATGGSSAMPHKQNPVDAVLVRAGAARTPGLATSLFAAGVAEHERAVGGWHSEWEPWRELLRVVGGIASRSATLLAGVRPDPARMRANLDATGGLVMAESVATRLAGRLGSSAAHDLVSRCAEQARSTGTAFRDALAADREIGSMLDAPELREALDPTAWLGTSPSMIDRALDEHRRHRGRGT
jgi:3-carboxy-cis,cis-muconate cycloisomerase